MKHTNTDEIVTEIEKRLRILLEPFGFNVYAQPENDPRINKRLMEVTFNIRLVVSEKGHSVIQGTQHRFSLEAMMFRTDRIRHIVMMVARDIVCQAMEYFDKDG